MTRFLYCLISVALAAGLTPPLRGQGPATTAIIDVVYRADSTPAGGTLFITWPAFATAEGKAVAAGSKSVLLAPGGTLNVSLVPNEGATPPGSFYKVVYQLDDGSTSEVCASSWSSPPLRSPSRPPRATSILRTPCWRTPSALCTTTSCCASAASTSTPSPMTPPSTASPQRSDHPFGL
jgi:hypothetical protein